MGDHDAPASWLDRWRHTEPLRLYLYGITVPLLGVALAYGWVTERQMGAWLAVTAALFLGSTVAGELARRQVTPVHGPTVDRWLEDVARDSYSRGVQDAVHRTPETVAMERIAGRCRSIESGNRCLLDSHGKDVPHHYG